jgi:hypothetical protein
MKWRDRGLKIVLPRLSLLPREKARLREKWTIGNSADVEVFVGCDNVVCSRHFSLTQCV